MIRLALPVVLLGTTLLVGACSDSSPAAPTPVNVPFSSTDLIVGTGAEATNGKTLTVNYTLWLYSETAADHKGTQVQTTVGGSPFTFVLGAGRVIAGWDQGVPGMKVGGRRELVIPPSLGYGSSAQPGIPANSTLVFDIDLLGVQ
jgi:FKBP-type peptidyl-prolyl cis-trans isomerase FkpA